ncbi:MAG: hypothetical protein J3R72DRAFT_446997 [Linnemannia gamsii]|nr:MAG: hypothetical protein J3R72DRAFT_446997 [Linnemannia gamsii]
MVAWSAWVLVVAHGLESGGMSKEGQGTGQGLSPSLSRSFVCLLFWPFAHNFLFCKTKGRKRETLIPHSCRPLHSFHTLCVCGE